MFMSSEPGNSSATYGFRMSNSWLTHQNEDQIYESFENLQNLIPRGVSPEEFEIEYVERDDEYLNEVKLQYDGEWPNHQMVTHKLEEQTKASRDFKKQEVIHLHALFSLLAQEVDESLGAEIERSEYEETGVGPTDIHKGAYSHERAVKNLASEVLPTEEWPIYHRAIAQDRSKVEIGDEIIEQVEDEFPQTFQ